MAAAKFLLLIHPTVLDRKLTTLKTVIVDAIQWRFPEVNSGYLTQMKSEKSDQVTCVISRIIMPPKSTWLYDWVALSAMCCLLAWLISHRTNWPECPVVDCLPCQHLNTEYLGLQCAATFRPWMRIPLKGPVNNVICIYHIGKVKLIMFALEVPNRLLNRCLTNWTWSWYHIKGHVVTSWMFIAIWLVQLTDWA